MAYSSELLSSYGATEKDFQLIISNLENQAQKINRRDQPQSDSRIYNRKKVHVIKMSILLNDLHTVPYF